MGHIRLSGDSHRHLTEGALEYRQHAAGNTAHLKSYIVTADIAAGLGLAQHARALVGQLELLEPSAADIAVEIDPIAGRLVVEARPFRCHQGAGSDPGSP